MKKAITMTTYQFVNYQFANNQFAEYLFANGQVSEYLFAKVLPLYLRSSAQSQALGS